MIKYTEYTILTIILFLLVDLFGLQIMFLFLLPTLLPYLFFLMKQKKIDIKETLFYTLCLLVFFIFSIKDTENIETLIENIYLIVFLNSFNLFYFLTKNIKFKIIVFIIYAAPIVFLYFNKGFLGE